MQNIIKNALFLLHFFFCFVGRSQNRPTADLSELGPTIIAVVHAETDSLLLNHSGLPYDLNNLSFEIKEVRPLKMGEMSYKYMLEGLDKRWSVAGKRTLVNYFSIPPGEYTFKVMSSVDESTWKSSPKSFSFVIGPPFWKTWWFRIFAILLVIAFLFLCVYLFNDQMRKYERQRIELQKRIDNIELQALRSQMNPHFIFNTMNSIQHYISSNDTDAASKYLTRFAKLMRAIMENSKQPSIRIKDEIEALRLYLELESMRFSNRFDFGILVDPVIDINYDEIPSMLIQPYIENAIIHGLLPNTGKGKLLIHLTKKENFIFCSIEDNGIGRLKSQELNKNRISQHRSMGMSITKKRLLILSQQNNMKDTLSEEITDVVDSEGKAAGTRVVIRIPVDNS